MKIEVTNCHDCPFQNVDQEEPSYCKAPGSEVEEFEMTGYGKTDLPEKCPLRKDHFEVRLAEIAAQKKKCEHRGILRYPNMTAIRCWCCGELITA